MISVMNVKEYDMDDMIRINEWIIVLDVLLGLIKLYLMN